MDGSIKQQKDGGCEKCGCSITAGLKNKLMDNLKMARETIQHIYKWRVNEASHSHAEGNGPALRVSQIRHTQKGQQKYDQHHWEDADMLHVPLVVY